MVLQNSNTEGYYRAVLSIQNKKNTNWTSIINSTPILINNNQNNALTSTSCIKIKDDNASFLIYEFKTDNNLLIFIDYNMQTYYADFITKINNLMLGFGFFLSTNFSNVGKMILKDSNIDFTKPFLISSHPNKGIIKQNMNELIPSYSTILNNVQNNIEYKTMIKYWHKIPTENIFNLYQKISEDKYCSNVVQIILGSCGDLSLYTCLQLFANLGVLAKWNKTELTLGEEKKISKPIKKEIIKQFQLILKEQKSKGTLSEDQFNIVNKRIPNIFGPSNRDILCGNFTANGIDLKKYEKIIIAHRNSIFHGEFDIPNLIQNEFDNFHFVYNALMSLFYRFVLKKVNYSGLILNINKLSFPNEELISEEPLLIII